MYYLELLGYECEGIELNRDAADVGRGRWDLMIMVGDMLDILPTLPDNAYDCVFTQSVLMHMEHPPMKEIARVARRVILTNEVEYPAKLEDLGKLRWARKYGFSGWRQVYYNQATGVKDISVATTRIFICETE